MDGLKGDVDCPIKIKIEPIDTVFKEFGIFRRSGAYVCTLQQAEEAETAPTKVFWPAVNDANCSGGTKLLQGAGQIAGNCGWLTWPPGGADISECGAFHIFARVRTDDAANTYFRQYTTISSYGGYISGLWKRVAEDDVWYWLDLGPVTVSTYGGLSPNTVHVSIFYQKPDAATVELDWWAFSPVDESAGWFRVFGTATNLGNNDEMIIDHLNEFPTSYWKQHTDTTVYRGYVTERGNRPITVAPAVDNRFTMKFLEYGIGGTPDVCDVAHDVAAGQSMSEVYFWYLPQYISPLE